jgi:hypothetical protein
MIDTVANIPNTNYFAAIPGATPTNFDTVGDCGACVQITNGGTSIVATVIDECPKDSNPACANNSHLDLSYAAWLALGYPVGNPSNTTWKFVPCPISGNVQVMIKSPVELYIENSILPIASVPGAVHTFYGSWQFSNNFPSSLTITDAAGRTLTINTGSQDTGKQFPPCQ